MKIQYRAGGIVKLGRMIRSERNAKRMTQREVAAKSGVTPSYLCRVEKGDTESPPRPEFVKRVAFAIGIDPVPLLLALGRDDCVAEANRMKRERKAAK